MDLNKGPSLAIKVWRMEVLLELCIAALRATTSTLLNCQRRLCEPVPACPSCWDSCCSCFGSRNGGTNVQFPCTERKAEKKASSTTVALQWLSRPAQLSARLCNVCWEMPWEGWKNSSVIINTQTFFFFFFYLLPMSFSAKFKVLSSPECSG